MGTSGSGILHLFISLLCALGTDTVQYFACLELNFIQGGFTLRKWFLSICNVFGKPIESLEFSSSRTADCIITRNQSSPLLSASDHILYIQHFREVYVQHIHIT